MGKNDLKVSIVIPVYNGSDYLAVAIDSALAQTYKNVEVVVVNDGSVDNGATEAIAKSYGNKIKYVSQVNGGVASALNTALEVMTGDVFTWLSHDDIHHANKVERNVDFYNRIGDPNAIICSYYSLIDGAGNKIQDVTFNLDALSRAPVRVLLNGCVNGCTLFIPVQIMKEFGPFDVEKKYTQDYFLWNKILEEYDFYCQQEFLVSYRIHPNQDTQKKSEAVNAEAEPLWRYMIDRRSELDRVFMEGSSFRYFDHLRNHLQYSPYKEAIAHASSRALRVMTETLVSIVVWNDVIDEFNFKAILKQTYTNIEILVVLSEQATIPAFVKIDRRVKIVRIKSNSRCFEFDNVLRQSKGEYIVVCTAGSVFEENRIEVQHKFMQLNGVKASMCSYFKNGILHSAEDLCELKSAMTIIQGDSVPDSYMFNKVCWYESIGFGPETQLPFNLQFVASLESCSDIAALSSPLLTF